MTHWTNELEALVASTIELIASVGFRRKMRPDGEVVGTFAPTAEERGRAAENHDRLKKWRVAVGSLLRRRAAVSNIRFPEIAEELAKLVSLTYESDGSMPVSQWRERTSAHAHDLRAELVAIVDHALPGETLPRRSKQAASPVFELHIAPVDESWHVIGRSPAGSASAVVPRPTLPPLPMPYRREMMKEFGHALFHSAFPAAVRTLLAETLAQGEGASRIRIRPEGELRGVPWELLHDGREFLGLSARTPVSRGLTEGAHAAVPVKGPLRVLVTASRTHPNEIDLRPGEGDLPLEVRTIQETLAPMITLGLLQLDIAVDGTLNGIRRLLRAAVDEDRPYHVWHFIGHGVDRHPKGATELLMPHRVGAPLLRTLFQDHPELRLVVLNCCLAGRVISEDAAASAFLESGVPAVVAMQYEIPDDVTIAFAEELYGTLLEGGDVDDAVTEARRAIYFLPGGGDWVTPVLFVRGSGDSISV